MQRRHEQGRKGLASQKCRQQQGMVMMVAMVLMCGLIFVAGTSAIHSSRQSHVTAVEIDNTRTFYAAEGAVEWAAGTLRQYLENNLDPTQAQLDALPQPSVYGFVIDNYQIVKQGSLTSGVLTAGDYAGLTGFVQRYAIQARANSERRGVTIAREIQHQFIPLFQFGVFYEEDLEIIPGPPMTFAGPIHTNGNLYMASENQIQCQSTVTAVGQYFHYRKDGAHADPPGSVLIRDQLGQWQNVWRGSYWLDNRRVSWPTEALTVWGGMFRDAAHGLAELRLPLPPTSDQHEIVERGVVGDGPMQREAKYWYKATVRYVDGVLTDSAGLPLNHPGVYSYVANQFKDTRQNRWMDVVNVDIGAMIAGGYVPPNRILYISHSSGDAPCVRIRNAQTLPVGGLTIATDLPLYVWGDYNTISKKGSALLSDAITLLSPAWLDANSSMPLSSRTPSAMTVNACVITGHVGTIDGSTYSGGLENLFRFLENWSGRTVTYRGSIIDLWFSRFATAPWSYGIYYTAPNRNWAYDTDLLSPANWPPGTPRVHTVQRGAWRQIS